MTRTNLTKPYSVNNNEIMPEKGLKEFCRDHGSYNNEDRKKI